MEPSTAGRAAECTLEQLEEYTSDSVAFVVNGSIVRCPKFLEVNGSLRLPSYEIQEGDEIETRSFYTVGQLAEFMDVDVNQEHVILVNNRRATFDTLIYENFTIEWTVHSYGSAAFVPAEGEAMETPEVGEYREETPEDIEKEQAAPAEEEALGQAEQNPEETASAAGAKEPEDDGSLLVYINGQPVRLTGKPQYIFVDIFNFYEFDLSASNGRAIITTLNGENASYSAVLKSGDTIELKWKEN